MKRAREFLRDRWEGGTVLALLFAFVAAAAWAGTPPPPYNSPNLATTNALGGVGNTDGYEAIVNSAATIDLLGLGVMTSNAALALRQNGGAVQTQIRVLTVRRVADDATANIAACVRLGPDENVTNPLTCGPSTMAGANYTGGCYLIQTGDQCTFLIRPIIAPASPCSTGVSGSSSCLPKLWSRTSTTVGLGVALAVTWAW